MNVEELIQSEEGRRHEAYLDTLGIATIGIGHTGSEVHQGLVWDDQQIDGAFFRDVAIAHDGIAAHLPWFDSLDEVRKAYVVSMAFQMGVDGVLGFPHTLGCLAAGDWAGAHAGVLQSKWASQTPARAARCAMAFLTGEWQQIS